MQYYEVLHLLLPRYLRVCDSQREATDVIDALRTMAMNKTSKMASTSFVAYEVEWMKACTFVCVPGYVAVNELEPLTLGLFPQDIASICSVNALGLGLLSKTAPSSSSSQSSLDVRNVNPIKVFDLCCCPGGKVTTPTIHLTLIYS